MDSLDDGPLRNPLLVPLSPEQDHLLNVIWEQVVQAGYTDEDPHWPFWDYVEASMYQTFPSLEDASEVLWSLPRLNMADRAPADPYGLVWSAANTINTSVPPQPDEIVGLTIAGIKRVEQRRNYPATSWLISEGLVGVINALANDSMTVEPKPREVVRKAAALENLTHWLRTPDRMQRRFSFTDELTRELLIHEPAHIFTSGGEVPLDPRRLRPYLATQTVDEYLALIADRAQQLTRSTRSTSPLTLIQTLDYLRLVVASVKPWENAERFGEAPDFQSAAALGATVSTADEFVNRMLGLASVIEQLGLPAVPENANIDDSHRSGSLNRLQYWLQEYLNEDAFARALEAIKDIRAVVSLRTLNAHPNTGTRVRSVRNLERIGLPAMIADWPHAWSVATGVLASAFDVIRQEIQSQDRARPARE